ncbi:MAG: prephenate dehydratase [Gammaproteobacteria bacterium]|nr:prephenate dehydratase [Gammaproteobacteria bacterium]
MSNNKQLNELRAQIDDLDTQLLELISQRARLARAVAQVKNSDDGDEGFYRPEREAQILRRVMDNNAGPLPQEEMARLFREIMSACLALEQQLRIAYLGPEGTFTQLAALKHFGHSVTTESLGSIDQVFREVEAGACHFGVVPIENSIEGVVNHTLDMLIDSPLKISGEVELRIHHHLLGRAEDLSGIKRVYSHQQSLAQCRRWLDDNLLAAERIAVSSNAEAARRAAGEPDSVAIAGEAAAEIYELDYLARNIEDHPDNTTRFLVIGRHITPPSGDDKTSLLVSGPNRSGLLYDLIKPLADNGINMTRLESRPSRQGLWDYVFFIDILGHADDKAVGKAMKALEAKAGVLKLLGSYPRAVL